MKATLIDVDYITEDERGIIRILLKRDHFFTLYDPNFLPYFYIRTNEDIKTGKIGECEILDVQDVKKTMGREEVSLKKVVCRHPKEVPILRGLMREFGRAYEHRITFGKRYLIDKQLTPMNFVEIEREGQNIKEIKDAGEAEIDFNVMVFDTEVHNPYGVPREKKDPIIIITYANKEHPNGKAVTWGDTGKSAKTEAEMIKEFCNLVKEKDVELLVGYNSAAFDLPYMKGRAKANGLQLSIGRDGSEPSINRRGMFAYANINGRIHFDVFHSVRFLSTVQALKTQRYTLEEVYAEMTGKKKKDMESHFLGTTWDDPSRRKELLEYAKSDAASTLELFDLVFPLEVEISRLTQLPITDASSSSLGQLVESFLMNVAANKGILIPNKPGGVDLEERVEESISGGYVKMPEPGIYDKIAVLDFRGIYPSIVCSYNLSPETLNCDCCKKDGHLSPLGHRFCKRKKGLIPEVLEDLLKQRAELKKRLKKEPHLKARSQALKYLTIAFWGMLRYVRARWYSREAAESITAWGRQHIQEAGKKAEEAGFKLLYQDTDSIFLLMGDKTEKDVLNLMDKLNRELPGSMELELEDFYTRGVFVAKKLKEEKNKGAKKKYALISKDGKIKIRGFELVRRDWSGIAKKTQKSVLKTILEEGDKEKAVGIVRNTIEDIRNGKIDKEDLTIYTQLRKKEYEVTSPEFAAAEKARKKGMKVKVGSIIGYVVTKNGKSISEKAQLVEFAEDYDPDYYIDHQIMPSVLKILGELGYREEDIKHGGKQSSLDGWF